MECIVISFIVDQGYYLIAQTKIGTNEAYSLVMLGTAGKNNLKITPKTGVPTFEKKIKEKNDSTGVESGWQDASDYDISCGIIYIHSFYFCINFVCKFSNSCGIVFNTI